MPNLTKTFFHSIKAAAIGSLLITVASTSSAFAGGHGRHNSNDSDQVRENKRNIEQNRNSIRRNSVGIGINTVGIIINAARIKGNKDGIEDNEKDIAENSKKYTK